MEIRGPAKGANAVARRRVACGGLALAIVALPSLAFADPAPAAPATGDATPQMQLRGVEDTMRASEDQRRRIETDIETIRADRARLNAALIDTTAKVQDAERQMDAGNARLATLQ